MIGVTQALIDLDALRHNFNRARSAAPNSKVMAVIKADAYGHGVQAAAKALQDADAFAVARVAEAIALRQDGHQKDIVILGGFQSPEEWQRVQQWQLQPVVHHPSQLDWMQQFSSQTPVVVWLKIDSGMHRLGIEPGQVAPVHQTLKQLPGIELIHWMTHFACADELENPATSAQIACFKSTTEPYPGDKSLANSAAILSRPEAHAEWVRPGIMLYGASPFIDQVGSESGLKQVMTLSSQIISLRTVQAGESVGYGATWTARKTSRVAAVGIGYGDGYPRQAQPGTPVWVGGKTVPLIGRVSMDSITVDVTDLDQVSVGDSVELWGANLPVETVAARCGTISYHLFCGITSRVPRVYMG